MAKQSEQPKASGPGAGLIRVVDQVPVDAIEVTPTLARQLSDQMRQSGATRVDRKTLPRQTLEQLWAEMDASATQRLGDRFGRVMSGVDPLIPKPTPRNPNAAANDPLTGRPRRSNAEMIQTMQDSIKALKEASENRMSAGAAAQVYVRGLKDLQDHTKQPASEISGMLERRAGIDRRTMRRIFEQGEFDSIPSDDGFSVQPLVGDFAPDPFAIRPSPEQRRQERITRALQPSPTSDDMIADTGAPDGFDLSGITELPENTTRTDQALAAGKALARGFARGVAGIPKGVALLFTEIESHVDDRMLKHPDAEVRDYLLYRMGVAMEEIANKAFPQDPRFAGTMTEQIGAGFGSSASFLAGGAFGRLLKLPQLISLMGMGSATQAVEQFEEALDFGATEDDARQAARWGALLGTSEAVPINRLFNRWDKLSGGLLDSSIKKALRSAGVQTVEEAGQEIFQTALSNKIAQEIYDKDRRIVDGIIEAGTVGGTVGAGTDLLFSLALGIRSRARRGRRLTGDAESGTTATPTTEASASPAQSPQPTTTPADTQGSAGASPSIAEQAPASQPAAPSADPAAAGVVTPETAAVPAERATAASAESGVVDGDVRATPVVLDSPESPTSSRTEPSATTLIPEADTPATRSARQIAAGPAAAVLTDPTTTPSEQDVGAMLDPQVTPENADLVIENAVSEAMVANPDARQAYNPTNTTQQIRQTVQDIGDPTTRLPIRQRRSVSPDVSLAVSAIAGVESTDSVVVADPGVGTLAAPSINAGARVQVSGDAATIGAVATPATDAGATQQTASVALIDAVSPSVQAEPAAIAQQVVGAVSQVADQGRVIAIVPRQIASSELLGQLAGQHNVTANISTNPGVVTGQAASILVIDKVGPQRLGTRTFTASTVTDLAGDQAASIRNIRRRAASPATEQANATPIQRNPQDDPAEQDAETAPARTTALVADGVRSGRGTRNRSSTLKGDGSRRAKVTPTEIRKTWELVTGAPIRVGRGLFAIRRALAWFSPTHHVIRMQSLNDLQTMAHEAGHAISSMIARGFRTDVSKRVRLGLANYPQDIRGELNKKGKELYGDRKPNGGYAEEGFAEYMAYRMWGTGIEQEMPKTHAWFEGILDTQPQLRQQIEAMEQMYDTWHGQGAIARLDAQIHRIKTNTGSQIGQAWESLTGFFSKWMWIDEFAILENRVRAIAEQMGIAPDQLPFDLRPDRLAKALNMGSYATASHYIRESAVNFAFEEVGPSLRTILQPIGNQRMDDFIRYALAARTIQLKTRTRPNGEPAPIDTGVAMADAHYTLAELSNDEFATALNELTQWFNHLMDYVIDAGGLAPDAANLMRAMNPIYLPLQRYFDEAVVNTGGGTGKGVGNQSSPFKRLKGSSRPITDPVAMFVEHAERMISFGNKLSIARSIVDLAETAGGAAWFAERLPGTSIPKSFKISDVVDQLQKAGADISDANLDAVLTTFSNMALPAGKENIVVFWRNGKQEAWQLDAEVYQAVQQLDKNYLPPVLRFLAFFKRGVQLGATAINPEFALVRNPIRDTWTWMIYSESRGTLARPAVMLEGLWKQLQKDPDAMKFSAAGGPMSSLLNQDRVEAKRQVEAMLATGFKEQAGVFVKHPIDAARMIFGSAFESSPRIAEFSSTLATHEAKHGVGRTATLAALLDAKDVTVNFTQRGALSGILNTILPFFNARIQGARKFYAVFSGGQGKGKAVRATVRAMASITVPSLLIWWMYKDEEWYQELPWWRRAGFWNISVDGGKTIISIPKPFELGYVFGTVPEMLMESFRKKNADDVNRAMWDTFKSFLPVGHVLDLVPAMMKPITENATNFRAFGERNIDPFYEVHDDSARLPKDRYNRWTTETAKQIGAWLNVSPRKVENFISGHTGGMGLDGLQWVETVIGLRSRDTRRTKTKADIPIVGTLFARPPSQSGRSRSVDELYERREILQQRNGSGVITREESRELRRIQKAADRMADIRAKRDASDFPYNSAEGYENANRKIVQLARDAMGRQ